MNDRELLELAAKAAGLFDDWIAPDYEVQWNGEGLWCFGMGKEILWNPIADDGDALWLAVKLGMRFDCDKSARATVCMVTPMMSTTVSHHNDPYAATRRAIVCTAAKIGKSL